MSRFYCCLFLIKDYGHRNPTEMYIRQTNRFFFLKKLSFILMCLQSVLPFPFSSKEPLQCLLVMPVHEVNKDIEGPKCKMTLTEDNKRS